MFHKYIIVGMINTLFGYLMFVIFIYLSFHYSIAVLFSTILGVIFNFITYGKYVFNNTSLSKIWRFVIVYIFIYSINILGLYCLKLYTINIYIAGAILILPLALIGFYLNKRFVYEKIN